MRVKADVEAGGTRLRVAFDAGGKQVVPRPGIQIQDGGLQSVAVADLEGLGFLALVFGRRIDASGQRGVAQGRRDLPDLVAFEIADGSDAGLAAAADFGHGLEQLHGVIGVLFEIAVADGEQLVVLRAVRDLKRWTTPGPRQRRAAEERDLHRADAVGHGLRIGPGVGEVLVVEEGTTRPSCSKTRVTSSK